MNCAVHVCLHCSLVSDLLLLQTPKGADNCSLTWLFLQISKRILIPPLWDHMLQNLRGAGEAPEALIRSMLADYGSPQEICWGWKRPNTLNCRNSMI